jgi:hypothetical protein
MKPQTTSDMLHLISGFHVARALYVAAKLGLADLLANGSQTCDELSVATQTDAASLHRLVRVLASAGVFGLGSGQRVELTPLAATLLTDAPGSLRGWAIDQLGGEHYAAWGELMHSVRTAETAFDHLYGQSAWAHRANNPQSGQDFDDGMASFMGAHDQSILAAYPFEKLHTLYDIAGGDGRFITTALNAHPDLHGLVMEMPHVVPRARQRVQDNGLTHRCQVVEGDVFKSIPQGGQAYLLARVIHDWNDAQAHTILATCRQAMAQDSVLLLVERLMPEHITISATSRALAVSDLNMLVMMGGQERTQSQFTTLLQAAGFQDITVNKTDGLLSVIEAHPK